jgi:hypothetical protein
VAILYHAIKGVDKKNSPFRRGVEGRRSGSVKKNRFIVRWVDLDGLRCRLGREATGRHQHAVVELPILGVEQGRGVALFRADVSPGALGQLQVRQLVPAQDQRCHQITRISDSHTLAILDYFNV